MKDKNGKQIEIGMQVLMPEPTDADTWGHEFEAEVEGFKNGFIEVSDGDGDWWTVEPERVEVPE